jgi:hypothetical protein
MAPSRFRGVPATDPPVFRQGLPANSKTCSTRQARTALPSQAQPTVAALARLLGRDRALHSTLEGGKTAAKSVIRPTPDKQKSVCPTALAPPRSAAAAEPAFSNRVTSILALTEKLLIRHRGFIRVKCPSVLKIALVIGDPDHQASSLSQPCPERSKVRHVPAPPQRRHSQLRRW